MKGAVCKAIFAGIVAAFAAGCDSSTTVEWQGDSSDGRVVATLHGIVTRQDTQTPIADVRILYSVQGAQQEARSDANGLYRIDGLPESSYSLIFLSPDSVYADREEQVVIEYEPPADFPSDRDYEIVIARDVIMYTRNADAGGYVFARLDNELTIPAAGVEVRASGFAWVLNSDFTTITDERGHYRFSNLPATPTATFMAMPWDYGDVPIGAASSTANLVAGGAVAVPNIIANLATSAVVIISNNYENNNFPVDGNLELVFSSPIDEESLEIVLARGIIGVAFTYSLSEDGLTLTIDPVAILRASSNYSISVSGRSLNFSSFDTGPAVFQTQDGIELLATNLWQQEGLPREDVELTEAITLDFSLEIDIEHPENEINMIHETTEVLIDFVYSDDRRRVTVTPVGSYVAGTEYNLEYRMYSRLPQDSDYQLIPFSTVLNVDLPGAVTGFSLNDPSIVDWNTTAFLVHWNAVAEAESYELYAYDSYSVSHHVRLASFAVEHPGGIEQRNVVLRSEFDWLTEDGILTPFTNGIDVMIKIRAVNVAGEGEFSPVLTISDVVAPTINTITQTGTASNEGSTQPRTATCRFGAPAEYCSTTPPTWEFVESGGNPNYVLPHDAASWEWDSDLRNGRLIIQVPPQMNGAGDLLRLSGVTDASGNVQQVAATRFLN